MTFAPSTWTGRGRPDGHERRSHLNPAAERLLGWRASEAEGQSRTVLMPSRMHARHIEAFGRFMATSEPRIIGRAVRVPAIRKDGVEIDMQLALSTSEAPGRRS